MSATFSISVDVQHSLVRLTLSGFFELEDVERMADAHRAALRQLRCPPNQHLTLVDARDLDIQAQESVAEFQRVLADRTAASRRIAFLVPLSLARTQVRRAAEGRDAGYFMSPDEAESWLLDENAAAA